VKKFNAVFTLLLIFVLAQLAGCQSSPGGIFSPSADLFVAKVEPSFLQPELSESAEGEGSTAATVVLPALALAFNVSNGVSCFVNSYVVRYYTPDGSSLNGGKFDHSGAISLLVDAPEMTWSPSEEEEETTTTGSGSAPNQTSIEVYLPSVYAFMNKGNTVITDDVSPVIAKIEFLGKDINDKEIRAAAQVNLVTTIKEADESE